MVALTFTAALLTVLLATKPQSWRELSAPPHAGEPSITLALESAPAEAPAAAPVAPAPPAPQKPLKHEAIPRQSTPAAAAVPAVSEPMPLEREPAPEGGAVVAASLAPGGGEASSNARLDLEAQYAASLRADIDRRTHPPDSAQYRLHRPSGEVRLRFIVNRAGESRGVTVVHQSGSTILDDAAVAIVASGRYPPMPAKVYPGEAEHVFAVTIEFRAPN